MTVTLSMISVILCTYNRCHSLSKALDSVAQSQLPESVNWEVLVIDNNSKDSTSDVVKRYCDLWPNRFRYIFEAQQGKSHALNRGIQEAHGDVLAFMDDDVTVEPTWLRNLTQNIFNGRYAGAGGRIVPDQTISLPTWMPLHERYGLAPLAMFDLGLAAGDLDEPPFGTNMAFQRRIFETYGSFRADLGPQPGSEIRNEDTEFGSRILAAGEKLRYEPTAVVYHAMPEKRLRKEYFLKWFFDKGRADVREHGIQAGTKWFVGGVPVYLLRRLAVWSLRWMFAITPSHRFACRLKAWSIAGAIREIKIQRNAGDPPEYASTHGSIS